jgi:hypothetical protein
MLKPLRLCAVRAMDRFVNGQVAPATVDAGEVVFEATDESPDDVHEFVVFRTDLDPTELPTDENGAVVETGEGIELIGEIKDIPVGETQSVTLDWRPATTS